MTGNERGETTPALAYSEREETLEFAEEAGEFGIFQWQVSDGTLQVSPKLLSLFGLADFDGRYDTWLRCIYREDILRFVDVVDTAFSEHAPAIRAEFRIVAPDTGALRWIEFRSMVFYDIDRQPHRVVGVNVDVTERKRALAQVRAFAETLEDRVRERTRQLEAENEARRFAEESLRQAQKMEAVGQLTGGIAHDFNNLLTVVMGGLDVISREVPKLPDSSAKERIGRWSEMAMDGARRAASLTSRLLAFSRRQPLSPVPLNANSLVAGISDLLRRTIGEEIALETVLAEGLWKIHADSNQLESALLNLALNSRDAMPDGGKLTIETANCYLDEDYVSKLPEPVSPGQYVQIAVADTGAGMSSQTIEKAFEPFFTTKEVGKGTGLGLSQVYGFVRQSAGHVNIYSEIAEGTTVKIYLPRHFGEERVAEAIRGEEGKVAAVGVESILVVEDDEPLRQYAKEVLTDLGYQVWEAADDRAALEIVDGGMPIDLLFTDIVMPGGMNGRQLADEVGNRRSGVRVLFTTGYTRNAIVHHGRLDPGVNVITKPFSSRELGEKVRSILDQEV